jgi:hypothetical protein
MLRNRPITVTKRVSPPPANRLRRRDRSPGKRKTKHPRVLVTAILHPSITGQEFYHEYMDEGRAILQSETDPYGPPGALQPIFWLCLIYGVLVAVSDDFYLAPVQPHQSALDILATWMQHEKIKKLLNTHLRHRFNGKKTVIQSDFVSLVGQLQEDSEIGVTEEHWEHLRGVEEALFQISPLGCCAYDARRVLSLSIKRKEKLHARKK